MSVDEKISQINKSITAAIGPLEDYTNIMYNNKNAIGNGILSLTIIWGMLVALLILSTFVYEGGIKKCRCCNYTLWTVLNAFWFIGIPASTALFISAIFLNDACSSFESISESDFTNFGFFSGEMKNMVSQCKQQGSGNLLSNLGLDIDNDFTPIMTNSTLPSKMSTEALSLGVTSLSLPIHSQVYATYTQYYSTFSNLEVIYGSSLSTLLLNAGTELSMLYNPTTVVFDAAQCPTSSTQITSNNALTATNRCILIKESLPLHAMYTAKKLKYLYQYKYSLYDIISNNALSLDQALLSKNKATANTIATTVNGVITKLPLINTKYRNLADAYNYTQQYLNCTLIGRDLNYVLIGLCGNVMKSVSGCSVVLLVASISTSFLVISMACFNKNFTHPTLENERLRIVAPIATEASIEIPINSDQKYRKNKMEERDTTNSSIKITARKLHKGK